MRRVVVDDWVVCIWGKSIFIVVRNSDCLGLWFRFVIRIFGKSVNSDNVIILVWEKV